MVHFDDRVAIVLLLEQPPAALQIEARELVAAALLAAREPRANLPRVRQLDLLLDALQPPRHGVAARALARRVCSERRRASSRSRVASAPLVPAPSAAARTKCASASAGLRRTASRSQKMAAVRIVIEPDTRSPG